MRVPTYKHDQAARHRFLARRYGHINERRRTIVDAIPETPAEPLPQRNAVAPVQIPKRRKDYMHAGCVVLAAAVVKTRQAYHAAMAMIPEARRLDAEAQAQDEE